MPLRKAVCFALRRLDSMSPWQARESVHEHKAADLDSFDDNAGFLEAVWKLTGRGQDRSHVQQPLRRSSVACWLGFGSLGLVFGRGPQVV